MATQPPSPPEPLALMAVKQNLRVTNTADDDLIAELITDAREFVERQSGQVLVPRVVTETATELGRWIDLSSWPVTNVIAIRFPVAGVMTSLPDSLWTASYMKRPVRVLPTSSGWGVGATGWNCIVRSQPSLPVEIDVQAGYATPAMVPRAATRAMHQLIAHWYDNKSAVEAGVRAAAVEIPLGVADMIDQLKLRRI